MEDGTEVDNRTHAVEPPFARAINRKLDALRGAVLTLVKASLYGLLDDDARAIMKDLDEVWDKD